MTTVAPGTGSALPATVMVPVMTRVCAVAAAGSSISAVAVTASQKRGRRTNPPYTNGLGKSTKWTRTESNWDGKKSSSVDADGTNGAKGRAVARSGAAHTLTQRIVRQPETSASEKMATTVTNGSRAASGRQ